jgi:microcystin-dependent protein
MSGTINLAFTQQFDSVGDPLSGGLLYFFTAGTTTPQSAFQDTGLITLHPNPIVLDASGRVPMFYLADGFIKVRLTDKNGVTIIAADQLLVIGPSSGGGGGGGGGSTGDVTAALQTGDIKARYDTGVKDGFVRLNGLTIGNIGSSATERQEAVCQPLFEYLWPFPNIALDGFAKGASALADWGGGRRLILPDLRGRTIAGMDDMGTTAASRLTNTFFGASAIVLGNAGGGESQTLTTAQTPSHLHPVASQHTGGNLSIAGEQEDHQHGWGGTFTSGGVNGSLDHSHQYGTAIGGVSGGGGAISASGTQGTTSGTNIGGMDHSHNVNVGGTTGARNAVHTHAIAGSTQLTGGGAAHPIVQPTMVLTFYMKM